MWSLLFAVLFNHSFWSQGEVFNAISELEPLLDTQKRLVHDLDFYTKKQEENLLAVKSYLSMYRQEHEKANEDVLSYLGNPINAFTLIKRLTVDLNLIKNHIKTNIENIQKITFSHDDLVYPTSVDLFGAVQAINRLKETYRLDIHELSEGMLNGVKYSTPLSASDCYELGRSLQLSTDKELKNSRGWLLETLRKFKESKGTVMYSFTELDIVEKIGLLSYFLNDIPTALHWIYELLKIDPKHTGALRNLPHLKELFARNEAVWDKQLQLYGVRDQNQNVGIKGNEQASQCSDCEEMLNSYEALCRGQIGIPAEITTRLKCWYTSEHHPFLKYAPFKVEQIYIDPDIFIFYEVMSDNEIENIKFMAQLRFVNAAHRGDGEFAHYRIGKVAVLKEEDSPLIARISQRVTDMTGLNMKTAEDLQIVNYGIGGHYEPHYDFAPMSDVPQGGATVFPELDLSVFPIKGASILWWNLHPSTEGDMATLHAACPVLRGSKWVSNKWLHQVGQELIRPCNLKLQVEGINNLPPRPQPKTPN